MPHIILSDGAINNRLLKLGGRDVEGVFLIFPVPFNRFQGQQYAVFGRDARDVLSRTLERTQAEYSSLAGENGGFKRSINWLVGLKRVGDARGAIRAFMRHSAGKEMFVLSDQTTLEFDQRGSPKNRTFNLWQIKNGKFCSWAVLGLRRPRG
jgi:hypothetical protein